MTSRLSLMPVRCEAIEMRNSTDADGFPCSRTASTQCFDCGSSLCESHTETCGICNGIFCPSCLSFHSVQHPKAASADREQHSGAKAHLRLNQQTSGVNVTASLGGG